MPIFDSVTNVTLPSYVMNYTCLGNDNLFEVLMYVLMVDHCRLVNYIGGFSSGQPKFLAALNVLIGMFFIADFLPAF